LPNQNRKAVLVRARDRSGNTADPPAISRPIPPPL
jgi:hypothetical protein